VESKISTFEIAGILRKNLWVIAAFAITGLVAGSLVAVLSEPVYRAEVTLVPANKMGQSQSIGGALGSLGGLAQFTGIDLNNNASTWANIATLESRTFIEQFIADEGLMPILFAERWDSQTGKWREKVGEDAPTLWDGYKQFDEKILDINWNTTTQLITLTVDWSDPNIAAEWANKLVQRINDQLREDAIAEAKKSLAYLNRELARTSIVGLRQSIFNLTESQIQQVMLANVREEYAFKVIGPAVPPDPDDYVWPRPFLTIILAAVLGLVSGITFAVVRAIWIHAD